MIEQSTSNWQPSQPLPPAEPGSAAELDGPEIGPETAAVETDQRAAASRRTHTAIGVRKAAIALLTLALLAFGGAAVVNAASPGSSPSPAASGSTGTGGTGTGGIGANPATTGHSCP